MGWRPSSNSAGVTTKKNDFEAAFDRALEMGYKNFLLLTGDWLPNKERAVHQNTWFPMDSSQMIHFINTRLRELAERFGEVPFPRLRGQSVFHSDECERRPPAFQTGSRGRFCQTQAITHVNTYKEWYRQIREGRQGAPRLTIPSIPLVGSRRAFAVLCRLPGVYVDPSLHAIMEQEDFQERALEWAFEIAEGVTENGAAGVHAMNFGMPSTLIDEFLRQIRDRANAARDRSRETLQNL